MLPLIHIKNQKIKNETFFSNLWINEICFIINLNYLIFIWAIKMIFIVKHRSSSKKVINYENIIINKSSPLT